MERSFQGEKIEQKETKIVSIRIEISGVNIMKVHILLQTFVYLNVAGWLNINTILKSIHWSSKIIEIEKEY